MDLPAGGVASGDRRRIAAYAVDPDLPVRSAAWNHLDAGAARPGRGLDKDWQPLERISPYLPQAVIASEDNRFCVHSGFDWMEMRGQVDRAMAGESTRGASTISMQVAKNGCFGRVATRCGSVRGLLTPQIELVWNKRRIMEIYLNVAETRARHLWCRGCGPDLFRQAGQELTQAARPP